MDKKILIVDDDQDIRSLAGKILQNANYIVLEAANGKEGLGMAVSEQPDLILLDINLPEMDGLEVLEKIRENQDLMKIAVVMLTGDSRADVVKKAAQSGISDYLVKPLKKPGDLIARVEKYANWRIEESWKDLESFQKKVLRKSLKAIYRFHLWAKEGRDTVPFDSLTETGKLIAKAAREGTFENVLTGVRNHSSETFVHTLRVALLLALFASYLNKKKIRRFNYQDILDITMGGLLHDIGKVDTPDSILHKPGKLAPEEMDVIKQHVMSGKRILKAMPEVTPMQTQIAIRHHEKWDGTGYPQGISEDNIGTPGLMAGIVDVFEALTARRKYKEEMSKEIALNLMKSDTFEDHFDDVLLNHFENMILSLSSLT